jgi:predicted RNA-binding protein with PUA-like domain
MNYWLIKSEPSEISINDLKRMPKHQRPWDGIRNYQARNYLKNSMTVGDIAFFYHSSCKSPGIVGQVTIVSEPRIDRLAFNPQSPYFDPKSTPEKPQWFCRDIRWLQTFSSPILLTTLKADPALQSMAVVQKGQRLSIMPVTQAEYNHILNTFASKL